MYTRFKILYQEVFDEEGNVKACGRSVCQELILLANQIEKDISHGNANTGMMDIDAIKKLHSNI